MAVLRPIVAPVRCNTMRLRPVLLRSEIVSNMASKQELDVVESWEEIDEIDVLERNLRKLLPPDVRSVESKLSSCDGSTNGAPINMILTGDDAFRSQYVPPEPTVKILKRPPNNVQANNCKSQQPKKTLQQREEEYAQARLRILGQAQSTDKLEEKICSIQSKQPRPAELDNLIRLPRGPDGSKGFKVRR